MPDAGGFRGSALASLPACALLVTLFFPAGCGAPPPRPDDVARALLASESFRLARTEALPSEAPGRCEDVTGAHPEWGRWISVGIARASTIVTSAGAVCRLTMDEVYRREAESWGQRALPRSPAAGADMILPVAVRSLVRVSEIRSLGRGVAEAAFEWQWRLNQAGQRLGIDTTPRPGWAQLVLDDGGWRATRVEPGVQ